MENIRYKRRSVRWLCAGVCSLSVLFGSFCFAANDDEPTPGELMKLASKQIRAEQYEKAVETIYAYLELVDPSTAPGVVRIAQDLRFKQISIIIKNLPPDRLPEAAAQLQVYIDKPYGEHPRLARSLLATALYEIKDYAGCVAAVDNALLYNEDPSSRAGETPKPEGAEEQVIVHSLATDKVFELEYSDEEITALYMTKAEAFYKNKQWQECIEPYEYVAEKTTNGQTKGYVIMQMINALVEAGDFDRISEWIPKLYKTPARFDIRVNLALMRVAAALYGEGKFNDALPLYRMILPREELLKYQEARLREMRVAAELPPEEGMKVDDGEALLFGLVDDEKKKAPAKEEVADAEPDGPTKTKEILELEKLLVQVKELPPYETDIKYRMAQIYDEVDRFWEAVTFLEIVYRSDTTVNSTNKMTEASFYQLIKILLKDLEDLDEGEHYAFEYLKTHKENVKPRQVAYQLTSYYQERNMMESIKKLHPILDSFVRSQDKDVIKYDAELYYMQGVADLVLYKFDSSATNFDYVVKEFPTADRANDALYWYGMSKLFLQKFEEGYAAFEEYAKKYPNGGWVDEAAYQGGLCQFGLENYTAASNRFNYVIATYPSKDRSSNKFSPIFAEACSMRGDLYGASGELRKAEIDYRAALDHAVKATQATYAVFQLAAIFKAEDNYQEIITLVKNYLDEWTDEADISKALFWIGKSKLQMGLVDEAVADYVAAIVEYGADITQDGVDLMIEELVNINLRWLDETKRDVLLAQLKTALGETDEPVLQLRLRVLMAMITKTEMILGRQLLAELPDFDDVTPPVLSTLCKVSLKEKDYSRAKELLDIFKDKFDDSDYIRDAYKLRVFGLFAQKDYDRTLELLDEVRNRFSTERDMYWAQLKRAELYLEQGKFQEAIDANMAVLGVPEWRGIPVARATYQLGQVEERMGHQGPAAKRDMHLNNAFAYYQRVYYQYKGYAEGYWAAEAYLACARVLKDLDREHDRRNIFRAMLFDRYVNGLPQAEVARKVLGAVEVAEIQRKVEGGAVTNIVVTVATKPIETKAATTNSVSAGGAK